MASLAAVPQDRGTCDSVPGLVDLQQQECLKNPESLLCVSQGAKAAITECQKQFQFERWNCTTSTNYSVFGPVLRKGEYNTDLDVAVVISCSSTLHTKPGFAQMNSCATLN